MSNFQKNGVSRMQNASSISEANHAFTKICSRCASHGLCGDCDSCPIAAAHAFTVDTFKLMEEVKHSRPRVPAPGFAR